MYLGLQCLPALCYLCLPCLFMHDVSTQVCCSAALPAWSEPQQASVEWHFAASAATECWLSHACHKPCNTTHCVLQAHTLTWHLVQGLSGSCCGMLFNSRGFKGAASHMGQQLEQSLIKASDGGKIPIVMDTSPCLAQMKGALTDPALRYASHGVAVIIPIRMGICQGRFTSVCSCLWALVLV